MAESFSSDRRVGNEVAGYQIERSLGRGASGETYLAEDGDGNRLVLKLIAERISTSDGFSDRFLQDVDRLVPLGHANVAAIRGGGEAAGHVYVAREHVEGTDLGELLANEGRLSADAVLAIAAQIAGALHAARWSCSVVHGSIKPSNVLLEEGAAAGAAGGVRLVDFGLWRRLDPAILVEDVQPEPAVDYLAPEQVLGGEPTSHSDQYALACVLYECLTGKPPFVGDARTVANAHLREEAPSARQARPELAPAIDHAIARALAKEPGDRHANCREFAAALRASPVQVETRPPVARVLESSVPALGVSPS